MFTMFDLPVTDEIKRKRYTTFRKGLLKLGFSMMQFSVYARYFSSQDATKSYIKRIRELIPPEGEVRILMVTDAQFGKMEVYRGKKRKKPEEPPSQLTLF